MTRAEIVPIAPRPMLLHASRALGKVDLHGHRGLTMLSIDEVEAMALLLALFGLVPTPPGKEPPETLIIQSEKETPNAV